MTETNNNGWWYSICYNTWLFDKDIRNELHLLLYITGFTANTWECFASNEHLSEKFNESLVTVSRKVNKLIQKGYIDAKYEKFWAKVTKRTITVNKFDKQTSKMITDDYQKWYSTVIKNDKYTNTSNTNTSNTNTSNTKEKEDLKATAKSIFQYYKDKFWTNKRTHKRAVALTRIEQQLKTTSLKDIEKAIDLYFEGKEIREPQFIKACENFFWNEPWTKIKFIYSFLEDIKEDEVLKNTPLHHLSESELRERIWDGLEELTAFKREIMDEFKTLSKEQQESFKQNLKKVEHSILTLAWIYK